MFMSETLTPPSSVASMLALIQIQELDCHSMLTYFLLKGAKHATPVKMYKHSQLRVQMLTLCCVCQQFGPVVFRASVCL